MNLRDRLRIDDYQLNRFDDMYSRYKKMYLDPDNCFPMFIVDVPVNNVPAFIERFNDPMAMLQAEFETLRRHLEIEDDRVPTFRVQFGTGQVASAFGCDTYVPDNELPCSRGGVINRIEDIFKMHKPAKEAGLYAKLKIFTEVFLENLPEGVHIQHPDIQSPFNNAHLIRGNDLFLDMYDDPDAVDALLNVITDYMIDMVPYLKSMISSDKEWFFDWGALWKGTARISNCSTTMISPEMYDRFVLPQDIRLMRAIGVGRMHYCGTSPKVIGSFLKNREISGLDYDSKLHDMWTLSELVPANVVMLQTIDVNTEEGQRLLSGNWPKKRNLVIQTNANSVEEGKAILKKLKQSVPG